MKQKVSPVTFHYMIITGGFWMAFCVVTAYAAVYLQGVGCSIAELGLILALGNVGGAVLSPVLGAWIDRNRRIRHAQLVYALLGLQLVLLAALRLNPQKSLLCTVNLALHACINTRSAIFQKRLNKLKIILVANYNVGLTECRNHRFCHVGMMAGPQSCNNNFLHILSILYNEKSYVKIMCFAFF